MNIVLTGYRCSGKTTVGRILAQRTGRRFVDTDERIEKAVGDSITSFVSEKGWHRFRQIEKGVIREVSKEAHLVIATGGGAVLDPENVKNLKKSGLIVWLQGDASVLKERFKMQMGHEIFRPPLMGRDSLEEFVHVLESRKALYEEVSDCAVDTTSLSPDEAAHLILHCLRQERQGKGHGGK